MVMSALPPKADMCGALAYVRFGPIADIREAICAKKKDRLAAVLVVGGIQYEISLCACPFYKVGMAVE